MKVYIVYRVAVMYETMGGRQSFAVSAPLDYDTAFALKVEYLATGHQVWMEEEKHVAQSEEGSRGDSVPLGRP